MKDRPAMQQRSDIIAGLRRDYDAAMLLMERVGRTISMLDRYPTVQPAPHIIIEKRSFSPERVEIVERDYPDKEIPTRVVLANINALPGPPVTWAQVGQKAFRIGLKRRPALISGYHRGDGSVEPLAPAAGSAKATAAPSDAAVSNPPANAAAITGTVNPVAGRPPVPEEPIQVAAPKPWPVGCQNIDACERKLECRTDGCQHQGTDLRPAIDLHVKAIRLRERFGADPAPKTKPPQSGQPAKSGFSMLGKDRT